MNDIHEPSSSVTSSSSLAAAMNKRPGKHPTYQGVRMRSWGRWVSEIREPRTDSRIWLGTFDTAEMAARAHDAATRAIKGPAHVLNFLDLAHLLPRAASAAPKDVQAAALFAASADFPCDANAKSPDSCSDARAAAFPCVANAKSPDICSMASSSSADFPIAKSSYSSFDASAASPHAEPEPVDAMFDDLPDLFLDLKYQSSSSWVVDDDVFGGLEEPLLWD